MPPDAVVSFKAYIARMSCPDDVAPAFLREGGAMGALMRSMDWAATPLGSPAGWPQSLKTAIGLMLRARQPIFVAWGEDLVSFYNDGCIPVCGDRHPLALGRPMAQAWPERWPTLAPLAEAVLRGEARWLEDMPFARTGDSGGPSSLSFSSTPLLDDDGRVNGLFCSAVETTHSVLLAQLRKRETERQRRMFEQAPGFICTLQGPRHVFDFINEGHRRLFRRPEVVGKAFLDAFPELRAQGFGEILDRVTATGERHVAHGVAVRLRAPDGGAERELLLDFVYAPVFDEAGRVSGIFCEGHDVTETHAMQQTLREREEQLRLATEAAEIGLWDVDLVTQRRYWQPRVKAMFGLGPDDPIGMDDLAGLLHPDDREAAQAAFVAACDGALRALYDVEYRTVGRHDGVVRWVAAKGRGIFDADGRCVRMIGTAIDITDRKAAEQAQRDAGLRKDEFIATLAHELRNPLAPLRNAVHLLRHRSPVDAGAARLHEMMDRQLNHLVRLVDDLLELSRISRGALDLQRTPVALQDCVAVACEATEPLLRERGHSLRVDAGAQPHWVLGDAVRLAQLLNNLLNNAARYTPPGGAVAVTVECEGDSVLVHVRDSGRGFSAEEAGRMFELFARGPDSPGLGIGLALAQRLAGLHEGTLQAHSPGPGRGATFTLRLPLVAAPAPPPADEAPAPPPDALPPIKVLVVDDNHDAGDTMDAVLQLLGAEVAVARSGREALAVFEAVRPQVVLLDIGMPDMDGYEVARRLRALFPALPFAIVGLSGWGQERDRQQGRAAGFDHHLVKPADIDALRTLLATLGQPAGGA